MPPFPIVTIVGIELGTKVEAEQEDGAWTTG